MALPVLSQSNIPETKLADDHGPQSGGGLSYYLKLVEEDPGDVNNLHMLAIAYSRLGQHDDARKTIKSAIVRSPDDTHLYQALGLIEEAAKRYVQALAAYQDALERVPSVYYRIDIARVLSANGQENEADKELNAIAFENAENFGVQILLGEYFKDQGEDGRAFAAYERARKIDVVRPESYLAQAKALGDKGRNREAIGILRRGQAKAPKDVEIPYNLGVALFREQEYAAAVQSYDKAIALEPSMAKAYNNKGVALDKMQALEKALLAFNKTIELDADFADGYYNKGLVLFRLKRFQGAEKAFLAALEVNPDLADAKFYLGEIYFQLGQPSKALAIYKEALKSNPNDAGFHRRMGDIYLEKGELDKAVNEYWEAVNNDERDDENREQLMRILIVRNQGDDMRRVVKLGEKGIDRNPAAVKVRAALADALSLQMKPLSAEKILLEGKEVTPKNPMAYAVIGHHYLGRGKLDKAEVAFKYALKLDNRSVDALYGMAVIAQNNGSAKVQEKKLKRVLAVSPAHALARMDLGCLLEQKGRHKSAKKELQRAIKDNSRLGTAWYCLAFAETALGAEEKAVDALRRATKVQPDLADAFFRLGEKLLAKGDKLGAKAAFSGAVKADSKHDKALLQLERLADVADAEPEKGAQK